MSRIIGLEIAEMIWYNWYMGLKKIHGFFGTTGHATTLDGMTYPALLKKYIELSKQ